MHAHHDVADPPGPPDHRRLGRQLGLYAPHDLVGAGLPLWLPDGAAVREQLEAFVIEADRKAGYQRVFSPVLGRRELYERSGHWQHFSDDMFPPMDLGSDQLVLRPSNCPHHLLIYGAAQHSFRDLPVRLAELGTQFRDERSGVLGGMSRVRAMTLSDAHVFVRPDQVVAEVAAMLEMIRSAYDVLGIRWCRVRLSLQGDAGSYADGDQAWRRSGDELRAGLQAADIAWQEEPDEAAFYGPKIDVQVVDPSGREETLSTVQVDRHLPEAFDLSYIAQDGGRQRPVVIHRGLVSTMERLTAHLIECYAGKFPVWLAPQQLAVLPVSDAHEPAAAALHDLALQANLRARVHPARRSLGARVRDAQLQGVPYVAVVGDREISDGTVTVRDRDGRLSQPLEQGEAIACVAAVAVRRALGLALHPLDAGMDADSG